MSEQQMAAAEFKAHCLQVLDEVQQSGKSLIVTKRGKPVARIVPIPKTNPGSLYGCLRDMLKIQGDLVESTGEMWEVDGD